MTGEAHLEMGTLDSGRTIVGSCILLRNTFITLDAQVITLNRPQYPPTLDCIIRKGKTMKIMALSANLAMITHLMIGIIRRKISVFEKNLIKFLFLKYLLVLLTDELIICISTLLSIKNHNHKR